MPDSVFRVANDDGDPLDALVELDGNDIILRSRGGSGDKAINPDYGPALRLILARAHAARWDLEGAWVDSNQVRDMPLADRQVLFSSDAPSTPDRVYTLLTQRMAHVRRPGTSGQGGNPTKRLRIRFLRSNFTGPIEVLQLVPAENDVRSQQRLPAAELEKVNPEALWRAVEKLRAGFDLGPYRPSTDYDILLDDGVRLPPKAVFGLAATEVLARPILPIHFTAGLSSPCFRILRAAGYSIAPKASPEVPAFQGVSTLAIEDGEWTEGRPKLVTHLKRERRSGLSAAKKSAFIREHGKLFCEHCKMDPMEFFQGPHGVACIEVHHSVVQVSEMNEDGDYTRLEDLQCLCANCHRVEHKLLRDRDANLLMEEDG